MAEPFAFDEYAAAMPNKAGEGKGWVAWTINHRNPNHFSILSDDGLSIKGLEIIGNDFDTARDDLSKSVFSAAERTKARAAIKALERAA